MKFVRLVYGKKHDLNNQKIKWTQLLGSCFQKTELENCKSAISKEGCSKIIVKKHSMQFLLPELYL